MRPSIRYCFIALCNLAAISLSSTLAAAGRHASVPVAQLIPTYHSIVPLGAIEYELKPIKRSFFVEAVAMDQEFEGMQVRSIDEQRRYLTDASGAPVQHYPDRLVFRVSAGRETKKLLDRYREPVHASCDLNYYVSHLQFRLKVFRGLKERLLTPRSTSMAVSSSKSEPRIYNILFDTGGIRLEDRLVLEVLAPDGERIGKFHLDLY